MITKNFYLRQIGPRDHEVPQMLQAIGVKSIDELIDKTIPSSIRLPEPLNLPDGISEAEFYALLKDLGSKNKVYRSFIGMGYYDTIMPPVILRNIIENPGWYTSYTPYQAEISQGRLEALLLFQTMICDLTGMEVCNCSLLDEATASAESMIMAYKARTREKEKNKANVFLASDRLFPQVLDVIIGKAEPLGMEVKVLPFEEFKFEDNVFGAIVQYPDEQGEIHDFSSLAQKAHDANVLLIASVDIMSLLLLTPPKEWGADIVVGTTQRFGAPMGYGGAHAAYLATKDDYKRHMPGRIIGISIDSHNQPALRMTLQMREQHIKRERATSNICTAQALLAITAAMYAVYHGPEGLKEIAYNINWHTGTLAREAEKLGYKQLNTDYFDTVKFRIPPEATIDKIKENALNSKMNFRYVDNETFAISFDETVTNKDINNILRVLASSANKQFTEFVCNQQTCSQVKTFDHKFVRKSSYLTYETFNKYHSETDMMRYIKSLEIRDIALNRSMVPLGSCSMKLTGAIKMFHLSWPEFANIHPFVPKDQAQGYLEMIHDMEKIFSEITGFAKFSLQPNSGAAGEYAGLMAIRSYHISRGESHRDVCFIPSSAHGTNPASAVQAGMELVIIKCDEKGNVDTADLKVKAETHKDKLSCLMITYPSTHGIFEEDILDIINIIHDCGGLVYMDGANMSAQVGYTHPGIMKADVCHINLHKTFGSPHGGGGPGIGPIGVAKHLVDFLPGHSVVEIEKGNKNRAVAAAPYGSAFILPIAYAYLKCMGNNGMKRATDFAILNANYLKAKIEKHFPILYTGKNGFVGHEMIVDMNNFLVTANITAIDIAKRLIDYGIHAPTVSFPVLGTFLVEPTESEPLKELDRFVEAMLKIREEIREIEEGKANKENNLLKNAPHLLKLLLEEEWTFPYSKKSAFMPVDISDKYFPPVGRLNEPYGDKAFVCRYQSKPGE